MTNPEKLRFIDRIKTAVALFKEVETYRVNIRADGFEYSGNLVDGIFSNNNRYGRSLLIAPPTSPLTAPGAR
ncbi:MAG: hypothetical protein MUP40_05095 [Actinobacteria bacterium]|nr:hypothetical protein [Actinomycetota bacterium]